MYTHVFLCFLMSFLFLLLSNFISFYFLSDEEKSSSFECGYMNLLESRSSFSIQFFLFSLVFLLFDVEVSFLLPFPLILSQHFLAYLGLMGFLFVLVLGLYYEWLKGVFNWVS